MARPPEYENLIRMGAFAEVKPTAGAVQGFLAHAADYLGAAEALDIARPMQVFTMAYEGLYQVVQAVLEHYEVRTKDAGRNAAIQRVCADLKLTPEEIRMVSAAHARRNGTAYQSPFPPISKAEATTLLAILKRLIPAARQLTGPVQP
jgi:hypothetical protein